MLRLFANLVTCGLFVLACALAVGFIAAAFVAVMSTLYLWGV